MTVRKGIPRLGKHRKEPDFGTKCPEAAGSVPTPEHAAGMGQETFSGRTGRLGIPAQQIKFSFLLTLFLKLQA